MSKALTLSIIIPAYNEENHLGMCLDSIAAQSVMPDEVIVVDNNSSDKTADIAKTYPFVRLLREPQQGVTFARDTGFNAAQSDIIGRIDADTRLAKDWVTRVKKTFADNEFAAVTGPAFFYDMPLAPRNYLADHAFKGPLYKYDKDFPFLFGTNMAIRASAWALIKSEVCNDKNIHEDMDIAIHLHLHDSKILYDPKLRAGMSARRFDDKPKDFYRYITMMQNSFTKHDMKPIGARVAIAAYTMGYVVLWPLRRAYDPRTGKRSARQLLRGHIARKNPME